MSASYEERTLIICRLCLQELENGIDIFTSFPKKRLPAKMIAELLQTCVSKEDDYPQMVCNECFKKLSRFYSMRNKNDLSTCAEFLLFKEQCQIAESTTDYAKEKARDGQHTPVSLDHSPLNLNLEELGMEDEVEVDTSSTPTEDDQFASLYIESSEDCSDEKQTITPIREDVSKCTTRNAANKFCKTSPRHARCPESVESKSKGRTRGEEIWGKKLSVPSKSDSLQKPGRKSNINDLKRCRIPRRRKPSTSLTSSCSTSSGMDSKLFGIEDQEGWDGGIDIKKDGKKIKSRRRRVLRTDKQLECHLCRRVFVLPRDLKGHLIYAHPDSIEAKGYITKESDITNSGNPRKGKFKINKDHDSSSDFSNIKYNVLPMSDIESKSICDGCGFKFDKVGQLEIHLAQHFDEENLICNICNVTFSHYRYMKRHFVRHLGLKKYSCGECGKRFDTWTNFRVHSVVHSKESPFKCSDCGKAFRSMMLLKMHLKTHNPIKPVHCDLCESTFVQRSDLKKHMAVHTRERKFVCTTCGKSYLHKRNLKGHERTHQKNTYRGYVCNYCGKTYMDIRNLRNHIRELFSHGEKIYNCKTSKQKKSKHKLRVVIK